MERLTPEEVPINDDFPYERLLAQMDLGDASEEPPESNPNQLFLELDTQVVSRDS